MIKDTVFPVELDPELRAAFLAEVRSVRRPAPQIIQDLMRDFIQRQRDSRKYNAFLYHKVEAARASVRAGKGRPNERVEAKFAKRRQAAKGRA